MISDFLWDFWRTLLRVPWTARRSNESNLKEIKSWICTRRTVAEAEAPTLWPPDAKSQLMGKNPLAGKDWRQKEKGVAGDEVARWYHWLNGYEFEQVLGDSGGRGSWLVRVDEVTKSWTWKRSCTLLLSDEMSYKYQLKSSCKICHLKLVLPS